MVRYGVDWRESDVQWASRWDIYLSMNNSVSDKVHWFSIINSILIVLFLTFMVAMILVRTVHRDISGYNRVMTSEEKAEEREVCFQPAPNLVNFDITQHQIL